MSTEPRKKQRHAIGALLAGPAVLALLVLAASPAFALTDAEKYGTVTINDADAGGEVIKDGEPHVCNFTFDFDLGIEASVVGWKVKVWNANPLDGETVLKGQTGPTDADGKVHVPDSGSLSAPNGRYNVVWDDEYPPDGSNGARSFVVDCAAAEPTPPTPTPPTPTPPTPTPTDLGVGGTEPTETPTETPNDLGVGGVTAVTPPPTDTAPTAVRTVDNGWIAVVISLLAAATVIFMTSWQRVSARASRR